MSHRRRSRDRRWPQKLNEELHELHSESLESDESPGARVRKDLPAPDSAARPAQHSRRQQTLLQGWCVQVTKRPLNRGMEVVRSDWTALREAGAAGVYQRLFTDQPVEIYLGLYRETVRTGRWTLLVYRKSCARRETYTAPHRRHVAAARKSAHRAVAESHRVCHDHGGRSARPIFNIRRIAALLSKQDRPVEAGMATLGLISTP